MRGHFAMAGKIDDWNAGLSTWLSYKCDNAMKLNASGSCADVPGKFSAAVWGTNVRNA